MTLPAMEVCRGTVNWEAEEVCAHARVCYLHERGQHLLVWKLQAW